MPKLLRTAVHLWLEKLKLLISAIWLQMEGLERQRGMERPGRSKKPGKSGLSVGIIYLWLRKHILDGL